MDSIVQKDFLTAKAEKRIRSVLLAFSEAAGLQLGAEMEAGAGTGLGQLAVNLPAVDDSQREDETDGGVAGATGEVASNAVAM